MKELAFEVRVRNNRLRERRIALGMNQRQLAAAAGVCPSSYGRLEGLKGSPRHVKTGEWITDAQRLAAFHQVPEEELFPAAIDAVRKTFTVTTLDVREAEEFLLSDHSRRLIAAPDARYDEADLSAAVVRALGNLPSRYEKALRLRMGFDGDGHEWTFDEIGGHFGVSKTRAMDIVEAAQRMLGHPTRSKELCQFVDARLPAYSDGVDR